MWWMRQEKGTRFGLPTTPSIPTALPRWWWWMATIASASTPRGTSSLGRSSSSIRGEEKGRGMLIGTHRCVPEWVWLWWQYMLYISQCGIIMISSDMVRQNSWSMLDWRGKWWNSSTDTHSQSNFTSQKVSHTVWQYLHVLQRWPYLVTFHFLV